MKKVACDLFNEGEYIYFNIGRLATLERKLKRPITEFLTNFGLTEIIEGYTVGMVQHGNRPAQWYETKLQECLENGTSLPEIMNPVLQAIAGSGILGKAEYFKQFPDEMTQDDKDELEAATKNE